MMTNRFYDLLAIHVAVFLFGAAGLFGKSLDLPPTLIVFGRVLFASLALTLAVLLLRVEIRIRHGRDLAGFLLLGTILVVHWITFYHSIQISTVATGLLTFSTFPIFVTFLEPLFFHERVRTFDLLISAIVFLGLVLVIPEFNVSNNLTLGVFWGTLSGCTFAILSILNRKFVMSYPALTVAWYQNAFACLILLPIAGSTTLHISYSDLSQLALLGIVFTALAHTLFIRGMYEIKTQLASVVACLEPVYGILLALILLHEAPSGREILGGGVILGAILCATTRPSGTGAGSGNE